MTRRLGKTVTKIGLAAACALTAACPAPDPAATLCQRGQECNLLGSGASIKGCTDYYDACVAALPAGERDDWERMVGDCLADNACQTFIHCFSQVPWCGTSSN